MIKNKHLKDTPRFWIPTLLLSLISMILSIFAIIASPAVSAAETAARPVLKRIAVSEQPFFADDLNFENLSASILGSIAYYKKLPGTRRFSFGRDSYTAAHLIRSLERLQGFIETKPSKTEFNAFMHQHYHIYTYMNIGQANPVLFTGYYEPLLHGRLKRSRTFHWPVYSRPSDLVEFELDGTKKIGRDTGKGIVPYYTRQEIEEKKGAAGINAIPIAWVSDPVALFFLHVQGSGKIQLENDKIINVHYLISNGHPYKSIGKYLIDKNKLSREIISMQSIQEYLSTHPQERKDILNFNPRYIFFETVDKGPVGCFNIELTPGRSIALDRLAATAATLVFIQTKKPKIDPSGKIIDWMNFSRFLLNQDTGSAIQGPGRADIFWGHGPYAEQAAGYMKHPGQYYFPVLKPESDQ